MTRASHSNVWLFTANIGLWKGTAPICLILREKLFLSCETIGKHAQAMKCWVEYNQLFISTKLWNSDTCLVHKFIKVRLWLVLLLAITVQLYDVPVLSESGTFQRLQKSKFQERIQNYLVSWGRRASCLQTYGGAVLHFTYSKTFLISLNTICMVFKHWPEITPTEDTAAYNFTV